MSQFANKSAGTLERRAGTSVRPRTLTSMDAVFAPGGALERALPDFEARP